MTTNDVSARPWYATEDCGKWCRGTHAPDSEVEDRDCWSDLYQVPLKYLPGSVRDGVHKPEGFTVNLSKGWREAEPHITLGSIEGSLDLTKLTLSEAERLAFLLTKLVDLARDGDNADVVDEGHREGHHPDYHGSAS
ncbi:hypothetical protein AB0C69_28515 [Actinomadura sp. NPDC048032]|uniref:hypothetical protein n=1 Tax=Actinomadura sp. NPDC048032 TaxID=3155747 RepID=UPI0033C56681